MESYKKTSRSGTIGLRAQFGLNEAHFPDVSNIDETTSFDLFPVNMINITRYLIFIQ